MSTVRAQFTATAAGFHSTISQIVADTQRIGTSASQSVTHANSSFGSLSGMLGKLGGAYLAFQGVTSGLAGLGAATIGANADMETYENTLTTLMGSHKEAVKTLDWAVKFAAATPFEIPQIVDATAKLTSYGIKAEDVLGGIGDMASIMGKPLDQAVEAVADAQTGELERLKEFGITKQQLIEKAATDYGKALYNTKGQLEDQDLLNKVLFDIMEERYSGGMKIASQSFKGMVSNVQDALGSMARELSKPMFEKLKSGLTSVVPVMSAAVQAIQGNWKGVKETLTGAFGPETALAIENFFLGIGAGVNEVKQYFIAFKPTIENLKTIFTNLGPVAKDAFIGIVAAVVLLAQGIQALLEPLTAIVAKITSWGGFIPVLYGVIAAFVSFKTMIAGVKAVHTAYNAIIAASTLLYRGYRAAMIASAIAGGGLRGVMAGMRAAMIAMNATMLANPFVLIAALIIGLGVALYTAYQKSETFRNAVNKIGSAIKTGFKAALDWLINFFTVTLPATWNTTKTFFSNIWTWLVGFFSKWGTTILAVVAPFIGIPLLIYQKWDQIKAWLAGVWNGVVAAVMPIVNKFINWIVNAFNGFKTTMSSVWSSVKGFFVNAWNAIVAFVMPIVNGFIKSIVAAWNNFKGNMMTILNPIKDFFVKTWENIKLLVLSIVGLFLDLLLGRWGDAKIALLGIWTAFKRQFENITNTIKTVGLAIFKIMMNGLKAIWNGIKSAAIAVWNALKSATTSTWNALKSAVVNAANGLKDGAIRAWNSLKSTAISLWNGLKSTVVNTATSLKTGVINAWNSLKTSAIAAVNALKTGAINTFNSLKTGATNAVNNTKTAVVNGFNNAKSAAVNAVTGLYTSVVSWFSKIPAKAQSTATSLVSKFKNINLASVGRNIIEGLYNGIAGAAKKVLNKANEIAEGITSKIKKALSIHSPSRVMEGLGEYTGEGLVNGMESMKKKVQNMAGKLASAIQTPISGNIVANAGNAVVESIQTIKHTFDLKNVPSHIDSSMLVDMLAKMVGNPKLQKTIDRINYKNNNGAKMPLGRV